MKTRHIALAAALMTAAACMGDFDIKDVPSVPRARKGGVGHTPREVALHNSERSCWLVLRGQVYDVTAFIPVHPGGRAILQGCGRDATRLFETRPMGSGTAHSSGAAETADRYYAGRLEPRR